MLISDFDGTLFIRERGISQQDLSLLEELPRLGILRTLATGRSLYSLERTLPGNFPLDYLIFSSGAGIMDFKSRKLLKSYSLSPEQVKSLSEVFIEKGLDFMLHLPIPENHHFLYYSSGNRNDDFSRRIELYSECALAMDTVYNKPATQFLIVEPCNSSLHRELEELLADFTVIRTTSPLDSCSIWIEVFPKEVSKSQGAKWLSNFVRLDESKILALGNDYNDEDLLYWARNKFIVPWAPELLLKKFPTLESEKNSFVSAAVERWIPTLS